LASEEHVKKYELKPAQEYHYVNQSDVYQVPGMDDDDEFQITMKCMENIGFTGTEIEQV